VLALLSAQIGQRGAIEDEGSDLFIPPGEGPIYEKQLQALVRFITKAAKLKEATGLPMPVNVSLATLP